MNLRTTLAIALASLMTACQQIETKDECGTKNMSFTVGFNVGKESISRGTISDCFTTLQVFDYKDGVLANDIIQTSEDESFGTVMLDAEYGSHEYVFVGHSTEPCEYDYENSELSFDKILDTFTAFQTLEIDIDTEESQTIKLERQVAGVKLIMLDAIPESAACIELTIEGYSPTLDPKTGKGKTGSKHTREWTYADSNIGMKNTSYTLYTFIPDDGHTVTVTVTLKDAEEGIIVKHTLEDISVEKNTMTVISGEFMSTGLTSTIEVESEWNDDIVVNL